MPSMRRHHYVMRQGIPVACRNLPNPLDASNETLADGGRIYQTSCVSCHGEQGRGDGPAASVLKTQPADLHHLVRMSMIANDAYLYWMIAEGDQPMRRICRRSKTRCRRARFGVSFTTFATSYEMPRALWSTDQDLPA